MKTIPTTFDMLETPGTNMRLAPFLLTIPLAYLMPTNTEMIQVIIAAIVAVVSMLYVRMVRHKRNFWGNFANHIAVIDHGRIGPSIVDMLPPRLHGQVLPCFAGDVQNMIDWIEDELSAAENEFYYDEKNPITVYPIYFAYGKRVNETDEQYVKHIIKVMDKMRLALHKEAATEGGEKLDGQTSRYERTYIMSGLNGSRF